MRMLGIVVEIVALDGWIKKYMEKGGEKARRTYGKISIRHCQNKGAMYSIGHKKPELVKKASLVITFSKNIPLMQLMRLILILKK